MDDLRLEGFASRDIVLTIQPSRYIFVGFFFFVAVEWVVVNWGGVVFIDGSGCLIREGS